MPSPLREFAFAALKMSRAGGLRKLRNKIYASFYDKLRSRHCSVYCVKKSSTASSSVPLNIMAPRACVRYVVFLDAIGLRAGNVIFPIRQPVATVRCQDRRRNSSSVDLDSLKQGSKGPFGWLRIPFPILPRYSRGYLGEV